MGIKSFFGNLFNKNDDDKKENSLESLIENIEQANEEHTEQNIDVDSYETLKEQIESSSIEGEYNTSFKEHLTDKIDDFISELEQKVELNSSMDKIEDIKEEVIEKSEEKISELKKDVVEKVQELSEIKEEIQEDLQEKIETIQEVATEQVVEKKGLFARLKEGLQKTSSSFTQKFDNLFKGYLKIDDDLYEELEEILITSDISFDTTLKIVDNLKTNIKNKNITDVNMVKPELKEVIYELLAENNSKLDIDNGQSVVIVVGVNGVGKTTTIGKLSSKLKKDGKSVLLAAGDTFRAAAEEQLEIWSKRVDVEIVRHQESGADPSAVIYDAIQKAKSKDIDVLICDTAGRLHNKVNLMNELSKIMRTVNKEHPDAKKEVLLVIDATTGQNALNQVKTFNEAVNLTGVILTKLDGTAKGGVVLSIIDEYNIPVKFIGVGEQVDDLQEFDARNFVDAMFDTDEEK